MMDPVSRFFSAWQMESAEERLATISGAVLPEVRYADPRTPEPVVGVNPLSDYVGMFSANAPGWSAKVISCDSIDGISRATVAFGGPGPDGKDMVQLGQYYVALDASDVDAPRISRMIGFVGTGSAE